MEFWNSWSYNLRQLLMWSRPVFWWMPCESCESVDEGAPLVAAKVEDFELLKTWAVLSKKQSR